MTPVANTTTTAAAPVPTETPKPAAPQKLVLIAEELPFDLILTSSVDQVDDLARQYVRKGEKVKETRDDYKDASKAFGKVACALEIRLERGKQQQLFPANKSLAEFIKDITGEKPPTHALTLKNAFGAFVVTKLITESDYNANSNNCLELGARVVDAVKGNLAHDAVLKAAQELKNRTAKEAKNLREILASVKPAAKLDAKEALELFHDICDDGHLVVCLAELPDIFAEMPETEQHDSYIAFARSLERLDKAVGEKADAWTLEASNTISITAAGQKVGQVTDGNVAMTEAQPEPVAA
jgi:hypothetical protein